MIPVRLFWFLIFIDTMISFIAGVFVAFTFIDEVVREENLVGFRRRVGDPPSPTGKEK